MRVYNDFDLTNFNSYRLKSICQKAYFPESEEDILEVYKSKLPHILLGSGHNIILSKEYYNKNFVIFNGNYNKMSVHKEENVLEAQAGAFMLDVSNAALENGLSGVEMFYDIPSSFGGAVIMNAGASGEEIKDVLTKVRYLDLEDLVVKEKNKEELDFEYRNSFFQKNTNKIVLKAWLKLSVASKEVIFNKMKKIKEDRWAKQPKEYPNAGSVFKRPKGKFVGPMLDELGLKGFTIGGAMVSEKHSGFIVNFENATGVDILDLISEIQQRVKLKFDIDLEIEQRII